ncbi:hypothetical protein C0991_008209 [Blastosporella zonata]|nr:hypothetical protein C0991_008209 [Blastosporella zonata]
MLPSAPPSRGLPSNPRPTARSRDDTADSPAEYRNNPQSQSFQPSEAPRMPLEPRRLPRDIEPQSAKRSVHQLAASSAKSLPKLKPGSGYVSSQATFEEDYRNLRSSSPSENAAKSLRLPPPPEEDRSTSHGKEEPYSSLVFLMMPTLDPGEGSVTGGALWNRVASSLTVSINKAWAANITTFSGEETPPHQESRLTRAMKAYHLAKARNPTDLPSWLFEEHEDRRPINRNESSPKIDSDMDDSSRPSQAVNKMTKSRGLREIYDAYHVPRAAQRLHNPKGPSLSKAADRLKAQREGKRTAPSSMTRPLPAERINEYDVASKTVVTQRPRVGLPSGPRRV